jgi:O-antigen/teichoic acid export membrane protein
MVSRATASGDVEAARGTIRAALRFSLLVLLAISAPIAGAADGVMTLAYPPEYSIGAPALGILVFAMAAFALFVIAATILSSAGSPGLAAAIAGAALVVGVVGNRMLVVREGIGGSSLAALAVGTTLGTTLALVASALAVYVRFRAFIAIPTAIRALLAAAVAFVVAHFVPHAGKLGALTALVAGFLAFVAAAIATGEIGKKDLTQVRAMLGGRS